MKMLLILFVLAPVSLAAQLRLEKIFSDHMVLQRDKPFPVWGKGVPAAQVSVTFAGDTIRTAVGQDSSWSVSLGPFRADTRPQSLLVLSGSEKIELKNILLGDLWVCLGQSNMEWPMRQERHFKEEIAQAGRPLIRFYNPTYAGKYIYGTPFTDSVISRLTPDAFYQGRWQVCDSSSLPGMSAVGYYFGKELVVQTGVPVGLVHLAIGGAPIETFISRKALAEDAAFSEKGKGNWLDNEALPVWVRERGRQNVGGKELLPASAGGPNHAFRPGFAFESGIESLTRLPVRGIIWYQGESNAQEEERVREYGALQKLLIRDYRQRWNSPDLPFYWVQLSSIDTARYRSHYWPQFRDGQRRLLQELEGVGMAVSSDVGARNDVHPTDKKTVGLRLARWALKEVHRKKVMPSGPLPLRATYSKGRVVVRFRYAGRFLQTPDGQAVRGFSTDGRTEAGARVRKRKVIIPVNERPAFVYYGWQPFTEANLLNSEGLPASTFKIDVD